MSGITWFVWKISWEKKQIGKKPVQEGLPYIFKAQVEKKYKYPGACRAVSCAVMTGHRINKWEGLMGLTLQPPARAAIN